MRQIWCGMEYCKECNHKNRIHLYLSHPISLRHMIRKMELAVEANSKIELLNPFYDAHRKEIIAMDKGEDTHKIYKKLNPDKIVGDDIAFLDSCDGIVSFLGDGDAKSFGTVCEIWDTYIKLKPIFIITHLLQNHPWVRFVTKNTHGKIFSTWKEFMDYACAGKIKVCPCPQRRCG